MSEQAFRSWEVALLVLNAVLLWLYVISTRRIENAAIQQVKTAARQADISAQQAKLAADQVEGASRPVLALHNSNYLNLQLKNIGNGPALNVKWWLWPEQDDRPGSLDAPDGRFGFIEATQSVEIPHAPSFLTNPARKVVCFYESVGGVAYRTDCWIKRDSMVGVWYEHKFGVVSNLET